MNPEALALPDFFIVYLSVGGQTYCRPMGFMVHLEEEFARFKTNMNGDDDYVNKAGAS